MFLIIVNINKTKESQMSVLIRIMTNYMQLMATVISFAPDFPDSITDIQMPSRILGGASDTFLSFDCFITDSAIKGPFPTTRLFKVFLTGLLPIGLTIFISLIWAVVHLFYPKFARDLTR